MTELVVCLSKDNWPHISRLVKDKEWEKIILVTDEHCKKNFKPEIKADFIIVDFKKPVFEVIEDIKRGLKGKISGVEVALNIVSGTGKEHMALMSALLKLGLGIRFVAVTKEGVKEI